MTGHNRRYSVNCPKVEEVSTVAYCATCAGVGVCHCALIEKFTDRPDVRRAHQQGDATQIVSLAVHHFTLSQGRLAQLCGLSQSMISRVVSGKRQVRNPESKAAVLARFTPSGFTPLGHNPVQPTRPFSEHDLHESFAEVTGLAVFSDFAGSALELVDGLVPAPPPATRLTSQDVDRLDTTTDTMERMDFFYGGGLSRRAILGQLTHVRDLYQHASCTPAVRTRLESTLARLCKVAAWAAFDDHEWSVARPYWILGLTMAKRADNAQVTTSLLTDMARASVHEGNPTLAVQQLSMATMTALASTPALRTAVSVVSARAHAALGSRDACLAHIDTAREHFDHHNPDTEPTWMAFWNGAQLAGDTGQALVPLAFDGSGEHTQAVDLLTSAVRDHTPEEARASALSCAKLARLHLVGGDTARARATTHAVLEAVSTVRSHRVRSDLEDLVEDTWVFGSADPDATWIRHNVQQALTSGQD